MFGLLLGTLSKFQAESQVKKEKVRGRKIDFSFQTKFSSPPFKFKLLFCSLV